MYEYLNFFSTCFWISTCKSFLQYRHGKRTQSSVVSGIRNSKFTSSGPLGLGQSTCNGRDTKDTQYRQNKRVSRKIERVSRPRQSSGERRVEKIGQNRKTELGYMYTLSYGKGMDRKVLFCSVSSCCFCGGFGRLTPKKCWCVWLSKFLIIIWKSMYFRETGEQEKGYFLKSDRCKEVPETIGRTVNWKREVEFVKDCKIVKTQKS